MAGALVDRLFFEMRPDGEFGALPLMAVGWFIEIVAFGSVKGMPSGVGESAGASGGEILLGNSFGIVIVRLVKIILERIKDGIDGRFASVVAGIGGKIENVNREKDGDKRKKSQDDGCFEESEARF